MDCRHRLRPRGDPFRRHPKRRGDGDLLPRPGAHFLNPGTRTIIDIGGQDSKAIKIDPDNGRVVEFVMNDKCAAGTGRFLEKIAELLDYRLEELGERALEAKKKIEISSQCVVFAESEVISLKARGERPRGHRGRNPFRLGPAGRTWSTDSAWSRTWSSPAASPAIADMKRALEEVMGHPIVTPRLDTVYAGALAPLLFAQRLASGQSLSETREVVRQ